MNWYVRYEGTDEISGPMTKEEALDKADRCDGLVFSENIFSPKIVTSEAVETIIAEMRSVATAGIVIPHVAQELLKRAIDTITLLSREKLIESSLEGGLFDIDGEMPSGVRLIVRDYDVEGLLDCDEERVVQDSSGRDCLQREY